MPEEENMGVTEPTADQPEVKEDGTAQAVQSDENHDESQKEEKDAQDQKRKDSDHNFAEMRRKMQQLERENREIKDYVNSIPKPQQAQSATPSEDDQDLVTRADLKKIVHGALRQKEVETLEERMQSKYPDFNAVVSPENIELLKQQEPGLARALDKLSDDPYTQAVEVYKAINRIRPKPVQDSIEKKKAQENAKKPLSVQSVSKNSAIGNVHAFENNLTPDVKKQLWGEMQKAIKAG